MVKRSLWSIAFLCFSLDQVLTSLDGWYSTLGLIVFWRSNLGSILFFVHFTRTYQPVASDHPAHLNTLSLSLSPIACCYQLSYRTSLSSHIVVRNCRSEKASCVTESLVVFLYAHKSDKNTLILYQTWHLMSIASKQQQYNS